MQREEQRKRIADIIGEINSVSYNKLNEEDRLVEDLKLDSINLVNLQVMVEDEFDIRFNPIEDNLADVFETVGSLLDYMESKLDR